jgi:hypothetical protein
VRAQLCEWICNLVGEFVVAGDDVMAQRQCRVPVEHPFQLGRGEHPINRGHYLKQETRGRRQLALFIAREYTGSRDM